MELSEKLDLLAEYHAQKDNIDAQKRALLDEIKVPAEVLKIQTDANDQSQRFSASQYRLIDALHKECAEKMDAIVIPPEVSAILDDIDRQRGIVSAYERAKEQEYREAADKKRAELFALSQEQTAKVYADIATRKAEIEAEFVNKAGAVDENIAKLENEIRNEAKAGKASVKGKYFMAVYNRGRVSWNTDALDKYADQHPEVAYFRKEGDPSVSIRPVK